MLGLTDGCMLVIGHGPALVMIPADGKIPEVLQIPEEFFVPSKPISTPGDRRYVRMGVVEDRSHGIWLWSQRSGAESSLAVERPVVRRKPEKSFSMIRFKDKEPMISEVDVWDESRLAVCLAGQGLFFLPLDAQSGTDSLQKQVEPEPGAQYIRLFFDRLLACRQHCAAHDHNQW